MWLEGGSQEVARTTIVSPAPERRRAQSGQIPAPRPCLHPGASRVFRPTEASLFFLC